ncbi:MAG: hypothetical protein EPO64_09025 [Nitrospirae bacterium]|nr:MAG: hypothetical protein EPO64_09025 [Nitrospirota bacterium]
MRMKWVSPLCLLVSLWVWMPQQGQADDLTNVIEGFMAKQFPEARNHFWVVNATQWQTDNEVVVDLNTVVLAKSGAPPTENRFLLLIIGGKLAAAQNIPLGSAADCQPEQT